LSDVGIGFTDGYSPGNWTVVTVGNGTNWFNASTLVVKGTNESVDQNGTYASGSTEATILAGETGTYSFDWDFVTVDGDIFEIAYYINGVRVDLSVAGGGLSQAGTVSFIANAGDLIGFGIESVDGCCGDGYAKFFNFTYPTLICGCTDAAACNYDPIATYDDGSCTFPGCTDSGANNYDPLAGCDDGSCCNAYTWYTLVVGGGSFPSEISWTVSNEDGELASGGAPSTTFLCYGFQSCLTIFENDSFGDGWNGGTWTLLDDADNVVSSGTLEGGSSGSDPMVGACTAGCINPFACNFDAAADVDDGSCTYPGCTDTNACNYYSIDVCDDGSCVYDDDDCTGSCVAYNGSPNGIGFTSAYGPGNWNITTVGNGNANMSNSSLILEGTNEFYEPDGDGFSVSGNSEATIIVAATGNFSFDWDYSTNDGDTYEIAYYINGVRTDLTIVGNGNIQGGSVAFFANEGDVIGFGIESTDGCCGDGHAHFYNFLYPLPSCGCTDPNACNYDASADFDNGCCHYQFGCMDYSAANYNPYALCDSGDCAWLDECGNFVDIGGNPFQFSGDFAPGDWTVDVGAGDGTVAIALTSMTIVGNNNSVFGVLTQASIVLSQSGMVSFDWNFSTTDAGPNFDPAYYINNVPVYFTDNAGPNQQNGSISFAANAGDVIGFGIDSTDGCCGNATLDISNFSGPQEGCTPGCNEVMACNYDPAANSNDGSCEYASCAGFTYPAAPEYNPLATLDDGTCTCPAAGGCQADLNGDLAINTSDLLLFLSVFGTLCP
jgi:hypothetical protein